jgi:Methyltransferase domain
MVVGRPGEYAQSKELEYWRDHAHKVGYDIHLSTYMRLFPFSSIDYTRDSVFDVGSGPVSSFESIAPADATVVPYDPLADEYNKIVKNKRFPICGSIPARRFTLITLFNVIDHMHQPSELLEELTNHLEENGSLWLYVHIDRPFTPAEHPQCFRFWQIIPLVGRYFDIQYCGLTRQSGLWPYAFWAICKPRQKARPFRSAPFIAKLGIQKYYFHFVRLVYKVARLTGLKRPARRS